METKFLLPHSLKKIGWIFFFPFMIIGLFVLFTNYEAGFLSGRMLTIYDSNKIFETNLGQVNWFKIIDVNFTQTIIGVVIILSLLLIAFSKEKNEDEFIRKVRLDALLMATYANYILLIICFILFYGMEFLYVMIFNMFTTLILFILYFNYLLNKSENTISNEE